MLNDENCIVFLTFHWIQNAVLYMSESCRLLIGLLVVCDKCIICKPYLYEKALFLLLLKISICSYVAMLSDASEFLIVRCWWSQIWRQEASNSVACFEPVLTKHRHCPHRRSRRYLQVFFFQTSVLFLYNNNIIIWKFIRHAKSASWIWDEFLCISKVLCFFSVLNILFSVINIISLWLYLCTCLCVVIFVLFVCVLFAVSNCYSVFVVYAWELA